MRALAKAATSTSLTLGSSSLALTRSTGCAYTRPTISPANGNCEFSRHSRMRNDGARRNVVAVTAFTLAPAVAATLIATRQSCSQSQAQRRARNAVLPKKPDACSKVMRPARYRSVSVQRLRSKVSAESRKLQEKWHKVWSGFNRMSVDISDADESGTEEGESQ